MEMEMHVRTNYNRDTVIHVGDWHPCKRVTCGGGGG